jgi:hypothetical protein
MADAVLLVFYYVGVFFLHSRGFPALPSRRDLHCHGNYRIQPRPKMNLSLMLVPGNCCVRGTWKDPRFFFFFDS